MTMMMNKQAKKKIKNENNYGKSLKKENNGCLIKKKYNNYKKQYFVFPMLKLMCL